MYIVHHQCFRTKPTKERVKYHLEYLTKIAKQLDMFIFFFFNPIQIITTTTKE